MNTQPEAILENNLIEQLKTLGFSYVTINNEEDLLANLKTQLEKHNKTTFTQKEFGQILNYLNKGNVFERSKILRDKMQLTKDNGDSTWIEFMQIEHWCQNHFQATNQISIEGKYKNRYDVTLLINGLPLVQIELKRRGLELKEAFNQINRYQKHSFWSVYGLFQYVQIFIISNGVNTKYFANNRHQSFKQAFSWSDDKNNNISNLTDFAKVFLEPCHISKMIAKYIVLNETFKILMVLRPYQFHATEAIIERVKNTHKNGYIWHTTGSGKTLTSFKTAQVLIELPKVHKVVFVVDRRDLDYQTIKEFNSFKKDSVDGTDNTRALVKQFSDDTKLIVTTIQKLNSAISKERFLKKMEHQKDKRIVFIFDECHRSQFGETHNRIKNFFTNSQMFGFTGTPIFADNAVRNEFGKRTTKELFEKCLHKYVITDAIRDNNVLKFSIDYIGRYKEKENSLTNIDIEVDEPKTDIKVKDINKKEAFDSPIRLEKIVDYIIAYHDSKTHNKNYTAIFCVSSINTLISYYEIFKRKKEEGKHKLKIATIFSYTTNEEDKEADGHLYEEDFSMAAEPKVAYMNQHSRDKLERFIEDYNKLYNTNFSTKDSETFYNYYKDIAKRAKDYEKAGFNIKNRVDIILVVNMFLTGFDAKKVNTLYTDKNLKLHGLIQAFSRTNRILNDQKSQGNIVSFRNLKQATDDAIALFSNPDAKEEIVLEPYEDYIRKFSEAFGKLLGITPTIKSVDDLKDEEQELKFVQAFRELMRLRNVLTTFADFTWEDLPMNEQSFNDYKSKYLDLYDKSKSDNTNDKESILDDVDFELELIHRDEINVAYILKLLAKLKKTKKKEDQNNQKKAIDNLLGGEAKLRSKKKLIKQFIDENLPHIANEKDINKEFQSFWTKEQKKAFNNLCQEETLDPDKLEKVISNYLFTQREPLWDEVLGMLQGKKPGIRERKTVAERIIKKLLNFVETYISGISDEE